MHRPDPEASPVQGGHGTGGSRLPLVLALALALAATATWRPLPTGIWHDDGVYLLIGKALAAGEGLVYAGVPGDLPAAKFPPLYPLVLTPFWLIGDDLAAGSGWVAALNVLFMSAAAAVFCRFLMRSGWSAATAGVTTLAAWSSPVLWRLTAIPLSEPLFLLLVWLGVATFPGAEGGQESRTTRPWWFVLAFGAAYLTRTAGVALLGAGVVAALARKRLRDGGTILVGGLLFVVPWAWWSASATASIPEPLRDILGSYGDWLGPQILADPARYAGIAAGNAWQLAIGLYEGLVPAGYALPGLPWILGPLVGLALVRGLPGTWRLSPICVLYPLGHLALLVLWPYRSVRLLAPALPFVALMAAVGLRAVVLSLAGRSRARGAALVLATALGLQLVAVSAWTLASGRHLAGYEVRARTLVRAVEAIEATTPRSAVVGAPELWAALHLHTGRLAAPSARFLPLAPPGQAGGTPGQQVELWRAAGLDHLLVEHGGNVHGPALDALEAECGAEAIRVLASFPGPGYLVRLNLPTGCDISP
ncbi:MAG: hypothetical protein HKO53_09595 [Gemmatimonadetes bacterium]|nr:hypothetical protein [Gemmatimonadota bacterium]